MLVAKSMNDSNSVSTLQFIAPWNWTSMYLATKNAQQSKHISAQTSQFYPFSFKQKFRSSVVPAGQNTV